MSLAHFAADCGPNLARSWRPCTFSKFGQNILFWPNLVGAGVGAQNRAGGISTIPSLGRRTNLEKSGVVFSGSTDFGAKKGRFLAKIDLFWWFQKWQRIAGFWPLLAIKIGRFFEKMAIFQKRGQTFSRDPIFWKAKNRLKNRRFFAIWQNFALTSRD